MPRFYRKVIRIRGLDSPNVQLGILQRSQGKTPTNEVITPGVLTYNEYVKRLQMWDVIRQCIGLEADFYEGAQVLMFPPLWYNASEARAVEVDRLIRRDKRKAKAIGIDPAEGGDKTAMAAVDEMGLIELVSKQTPDTSLITAEAIAFGKKWQCPHENWVFDRGGGGKEHADRLVAMGYRGVRTVAFGESVTLDLRRGLYQIEVRKDNLAERYVYVNRRAQMYWELRQLLDPSIMQDKLFALPVEYTELRRQLSPIPVMYDGEGRIRMLPKNKRDKDSDEKTLTDLIGCSPDEADAVVLGCFGMLHKGFKGKAGAA